ncbi:MAG: alpha/beta fold hydrolase [Acidiphilium sp.]|nr:alpha/beta fold hydrolase [Acidiphilium sp.]MDD4934234.1 alpha/beta fold hydrolase [Acidiphilium sp.]
MIPNLAVNAYRAGLLILAILALSGCAAPFRIPTSTARHPIVTDGDFTLASGARLPYRAWRPGRDPRAVVLALHGFNDSRDAWVMPAPRLAAAGIAVFAPDQRGFGAAPGRGYWPGTARLVSDARQMVATLHRRFPGVPLSVMGESMGGAVALLLGAQGDAAVASYVLVSPAVWGGKALASPLRASLAITNMFAPGLRLTGQQAHIRASDNIPALIAFSQDPLTIHATRIATIAGLARLMGQAQAACARFAPPHALILYGGHDQLIPKSAMAACWRELPASSSDRTAYYPPDYHLMLLDHQRATPTDDIIGFILHPNRPLRSDAATNAMIFSAEH